MSDVGCPKREEAGVSRANREQCCLVVWIVSAAISGLIIHIQGIDLLVRTSIFLNPTIALPVRNDSAVLLKS